MAYCSAFQSNCFQSNAFQIKRRASAPQQAIRPAGGYYHPSIYEQSRHDLRRRALAEERAELNRINDEIAEAEKRRLAAKKRARATLLAEKAAKKLAALEASLQEEISRLRMEQAWLIRRIDDEECILILMMRKKLCLG